MPKRKKIIAIVFIVLAVIALGISFETYLDHKEDQEKIYAYKPIIPLIGLKPDDNFETKTDKIRIFLFEHTQYSEGEDFHAIWHNHPVIAQKIIAHAKGTSEKRAPLECSARSAAFENILINLGYDVRTVVVHVDGEEYISHTFSEVRDPATGNWHAHDVQFNAYWRMTDTKRRASISDLIKYDFTAYEPCITPEQCGWDIPNREGNFARNLKGHFGLASIKDYQRGKRPLLVNTQRFDLSKPQKTSKGNLTYCDYRAKNCREDIIRFE